MKLRLCFQRNCIFPILTLCVFYFCSLAHAADLRVSVQTAAADKGVKTGSAEFTATNDAGGDSGPYNLIVRTNDKISYEVQLSNNGVDQNVRFISTLPTGPNGELYADWLAVPVECMLPDSSISADGQTLDCVVGDFNSSTSRSILPLAEIRPDAPNGATMALPTTSVTSTQQPTPVPNTNSQTVTISAAPRFNLSHQTPSSTNPNYVVRNATGPDGTTPGFLLVWPLNISAVDTITSNTSDEKKGLAPLQGPVTLQSVLANVTANDAVAEAAFRSNAVLYNAAGSGWVNPLSNTTGGCVYASNNAQLSITGYRTVKNGTCTATQTGGAGGPISISLGNMTTDGSVGRATNNKYNIMSRVLLIWIPETVIPNNTTVNFTSNYSGFNPISLSGQPNVQSSTSDDQLNFSVNRTAGGGTRKAVANIRIGTINTRNYTDGARNWARVLLNNTGTADLENAILCNKYDNTKFVLYGTGSGVNGSTADTAASIRQIRKPAGWRNSDFAIEYGVGGINGVGDTWASASDQANATCADDQSPTWYTDANKNTIPGGLKAVTKIRMRVLKPIPSGALVALGSKWRATATAEIGPTTGTRWPDNQEFRAWGTVAADGLTFGSRATTTDSTGRVWRTDANVTNPTNRGNDLIDAATIIAAKVNVTQAVPKVVYQNGQVVNNVSNQDTVPAGATVTYQLSPTLTTTSSNIGTSTYPVTITSTLAASMDYIPGTASRVPDSVTTNASGVTTLTWTIPNVKPNDSVPPFTFDVRMSQSLPDGTNRRHRTQASSPADINTVTRNFDLRVSNPPGFRVSKTVLTPRVEPGGTALFKLSWFSIGTGTTGNFQFIDVLPYVGDNTNQSNLGFLARSPASAYTGTTGLAAEITPPSNDNSMLFYYTNASPTTIHQDPEHASNNLNTGSTKWCLFSNFGTAGCPASLAAVTAVQGRSSLAILSSFTEYTLTIPITTSNQPSNGDIYANTFTARASGLDNSISSQVAYAVVDVSSLSGSVYNDLNNDGNKAAGETGIANVKIVLGGYRFGADGQDNGGSGDDVAIEYSTLTDSNGDFAFITGSDKIATGNNPSLPSALIPSFLGLAPGRYSLTETQPSGWNDGQEKAGTAGGNTSTNDVISDISLVAGSVASGYLFGEFQDTTPPSITKWVDACDTTLASCPPVHDYGDPPANSANALPGQLLKYTIIFKNLSSQTLGNVAIRDQIPPHTTLFRIRVEGLNGVTGTPLYRVGNTGPYTTTAPTNANSGDFVWAGLDSNGDNLIDNNDTVPSGGEVRMIVHVKLQ